MKHLLIPNRFFVSLAEKAAHSNAEIQQQVDRVQRDLGVARRRRRSLSEIRRRTPAEDEKLSELRRLIPQKQRKLNQLESKLRPVSSDPGGQMLRVQSIPRQRLEHLSGLLPKSGATTELSEVLLVVQVAGEQHPHTRLEGTSWVRCSLSGVLPDASEFDAEVCPAGTAVTEHWSCQVLPLGWNTELFSVTGAAMHGLLDHFKISILEGDTNNLKPLKEATELYGALRQTARSEAQSAAEQVVMGLIRRPWQAVYADSPAPADFEGQDLHEMLPYFQDLLWEFRYHQRFHEILRRSLRTYLPRQASGRTSESEELEQQVQSLHQVLAFKLTQSAYRNTHWLAPAPKGGQDGPLGNILHKTYRYLAQKEARREAGLLPAPASADWDPLPVQELLLEGAKLAGRAVSLERADLLVQQGLEGLRDLTSFVTQYSELVRLSAGCLRVLHRESSEQRSVFGKSYSHRVQRAVLLQETVFSFVAGAFSDRGADELSGALQSLAKQGFEGKDIEVPEDDLLRQQLCVIATGDRVRDLPQPLPEELQRQLKRAREAYQAMPAEWHAAEVRDREWRQVCRWDSLLTGNYLPLQQWVTERTWVLNKADYWSNDDQRRSVQRRRYCAAALRLFQQRVIAVAPQRLKDECLLRLAAGADLDQLACYCAEKGAEAAAGGGTSDSLGTWLSKFLTQSEQHEFCQNPGGESAKRLAANVTAKLTREGDKWTGEHLKLLLQWVLEARDFGRLVRRSLACAGVVQDCSDGHSLAERLQLWLQQYEDFPNQKFRHVAGETGDAWSEDLQDIAAEDSEHV